MAPSRAPFICARCAQSIRSQSNKIGSRAFSTSTSRNRERTTVAYTPGPTEELPRWKQTPPAMQMPIRLRPEPNGPTWKVNTDDEVLDQMYDRFIGKSGEAAKGQVESTRGRDLLPEEIKWLAVTHKSFDHARRGFNDRLAFLGKRLVDMQLSAALLNAPRPQGISKPPAKQVYQHPALDGLENVTLMAKHNVTERTRMAKLAAAYGIDKVVRWKPKKSDNLEGSGRDTVLAHTMYSIVGALALQRGGEVSTKVVKDRILKPLGLT